MYTQHSDDEPFIDESVFGKVTLLVEAKHGPVIEAKVRKMLFAVMNDKSSVSFLTSLSRAKTIAEVPETERSRYHSFGTMYFKRMKGKRSKPIKPASRDGMWSQIQSLCAQEQYSRAVEAGEDRLSPEWEPSYEGPVWEDNN